MTFWSELAAGDSAPQFLDSDPGHFRQRAGLFETHAMVWMHTKKIVIEPGLGLGRRVQLFDHPLEGFESLMHC